MTYRFRTCLAAAAVGTTLTLAAPMVTPAGAAANAPALYASSLKVAGSASVHFSSRAVESGAVLEVVGDTGVSKGSQVLVIASSKAIESLEVILIGVTGYVRGNTTALEKILGLSAAQAKKNLDTWLSFPATQKGLSALVGGLLNADVAQELKMTGPYTFGSKKKINGVHTIGINGTASIASGGTVPMELFVETGKVPRPIEQITNPKKQATSIQEDVLFSHWGEKNHTKAPTHSITLASLLGTT
jgi:hypothetical protein